MSGLPKYLTTQDVAALLQVHPGSLANDRSAGRGIPYVRIGAKVRYLLSDVEEFVLGGRVQPHNGAAA